MSLCVRDLVGMTRATYRCVLANARRGWRFTVRSVLAIARRGWRFTVRSVLRVSLSCGGRVGRIERLAVDLRLVPHVTLVAKITTVGAISDNLSPATITPLRSIASNELWCEVAACLSRLRPLWWDGTDIALVCSECINLSGCSTGVRVICWFAVASAIAGGQGLQLSFVR